MHSSRRNSLLLLCWLLLAGCAPSASAVQTAIAQTQAVVTPPPQIPEAHWDAVDRLIDDGSTLTVLIETGLDFEEFKAQLVTYKSRHDVVLESIGEFVPRPVQTAMNQALLGWSLAYELLSIKAQGGTEPNEYDWPNFEATMNFLGDDAVTRAYLQPKDKKLVGKKYLKFDENISTLLQKANAEFVKARSALISLKK